MYESATMLVAVFRRLKEGATFEDFIAAWEADKGFGVLARVFNSVSLEDPREILSVGFVDIGAEAFEQATAGVADQEEVRHGRIDDVIDQVRANNRKGESKCPV